MPGLGTARTSYRGWQLTARCFLKWRPLHAPRQLPQYSASGRANLMEGASQDAWVDARPQTVTNVGGPCHNEYDCLALVISELKVLIDALQK